MVRWPWLVFAATQADEALATRRYKLMKGSTRNCVPEYQSD
jgi:hypothetical protein